MAGVTWIIWLLCVAGGHLSSTASVVSAAMAVQTGQNVSLACNLTLSTDVTWYFLRSDRLQPLLEVTLSKVIGEIEMINYYADNSRIDKSGALANGSVGLEIQEVEESDAGLYFCSVRCPMGVCFHTGILLVVDGVDGESAWQPCWTLGICVVAASLLLSVAIVTGICLCSGKPGVCCCNSLRSSAEVTEEKTLHYSSLNLANMPRPPGQGWTGLVEEEVTYSAVMRPKNASGSHDQRC